jgi:hypothetical protein
MLRNQPPQRGDDDEALAEADTMAVLDLDDLKQRDGPDA